MNINRSIKVIVAGGGTGGHIFPAIAIANALKYLEPSCEILFVGAKGKMEMEKVPKAGYKIIGLDIAGFNRSSMVKNLLLPMKLLKSFWQAYQVLNQFKPDVAVGVGGYASFPILYLAQRKGIPTLLQEQNSLAGKSNKVLGKKAKAVCVAYDGMEKFFPSDVLVKTGNPVRASISQSKLLKEDGLRFFDFDQSKKVLFVFGGSLGAKSINESLLNGIQTLRDADIQVIWQTGKAFYKKALEATKGMEKNIKVFDFISEMDAAYAAADAIISRAGASSIAELCIVGKPVIFVPFPFASEDHQTHNAMALVKHNAALLVKDNEAQTDLVKKTQLLLNDNMQCSMMKKNIKQLAILDADMHIAETVIQLIA